MHDCLVREGSGRCPLWPVASTASALGRA